MVKENINYGLALLATILTTSLSQAEDTAATPLVDRLLEANAKIRTMRCEIRRETEAEGITVPTLSRVWFERSDRLHVETVTPDTRRIVVDGQTIYKWIDGQTNGVQIPLSEAPAPELIQVRRVPATAEEYLLRLRGIPESTLPPKDGFPVRRAYTPPAPHPYTVLALDETGRLARLEFFDPSTHTNQLLQVDFGNWREINPGIWVPCLQIAKANGVNQPKVRETLRVSNLSVNEPIDPDHFNVVRQATGVQFLKPAEMKEHLRRQKNP
jgi:hypothetical protein